MINKKKFCICFLFLILIGLQSTFAVAPVLDVANLLNSIDQLYAIYDQINSTIEQVQNTYEQLKTQIEAVENINWDEVAQSWNNGGDWASTGDKLADGWRDIGIARDKARNAASVINSNLALITKVKDTMLNKTVSFGKVKYSLGGLFGFGQYQNNTIFDLPKNMYDYLADASKELCADWANDLTYQQKKDIMQKYGISPEAYAVERIVEEQVQNICDTFLTKGDEGYYQNCLTQMLNDNKAIDAMVSNSGNSIVAGMSATTEALLQLKGHFFELSRGLTDICTFYARTEVYEKVKQKTIENREYKEKAFREMEYLNRTGTIPEWM